MKLSINEAIGELQTIQNDFDLVLTDSQITSLDYAIMALKVIDDGNFILKGVSDNG